MKLTREQVQALINAIATIAIVILTLFGYNVTILDPAKRVIIEKSDMITGQVEELNTRLETIASLVTQEQPMIAGGVTHHSGLSLTPQTAISVTEGLTLTLTGTSHPLESAGNASFNLPACSAGDLLLLINTANVTLTDTGQVKLAGNWDGGQYDSLILWCDGTRWIEVSRADN
ncbi:MAG: hypothetical protein ACUVXG_13960 [Anaerolineae bacterium]